MQPRFSAISFKLNGGPGLDYKAANVRFPEFEIPLRKARQCAKTPDIGGRRRMLEIAFVWPSPRKFFCLLPEDDVVAFVRPTFWVLSGGC